MRYPDCRYLFFQTQPQTHRPALHLLQTFRGDQQEQTLLLPARRQQAEALPRGLLTLLRQVANQKMELPQPPGTPVLALDGILLAWTVLLPIAWISTSRAYHHRCSRCLPSVAPPARKVQMVPLLRDAWIRANQAHPPPWSMVVQPPACFGQLLNPATSPAHRPLISLRQVQTLDPRSPSPLQKEPWL